MMARSESRYGAYLAAQGEAGLQRSLIDMRPLDARLIEVAEKTYVNFSSNDYLALRFHPALIGRAKLWLEAFGAGSGASRLVTGNLEAFSIVEAKIAKLKRKEAALVMASGFQTNGAVLQALLDPQVLGGRPLVFADKLNHASMHFGCAAAGIRQQRYRHRDAGHLAELLEKSKGEEAPRFILTESVFSMDGDVAPLEEIGALAKEYGATLIVDDAHGTGVLGSEGEGLSEGADIVIGTASKALGGYGAFVACSKEIRDYLVNRCSGLIYSTALPPAVLGAMDAALDLLPNLREARATAARLSKRFRDGTNSLEFETGASQTQIVPVIVGSAQAAQGLSRKLRAAGHWATAIRPPTVPKGTARLRFAFTAAHTDADVDDLLNVLEQAGPGSISGPLAAE
ncbi:8-amino-7-oxononanoate synthase 2 [Methyloligella halotolerans]|uniref:8-amino-7-oxononanoate synthase 2 n=1 Tax=Methyloligella halotolerans TaxID=1177755 RepID=A0A1E2S3C5_9HYPH|nr:8-amino-7-oxononanoate synthase [Methyloligella halotolerans]ODA68941.1 8-amino-7-oxononanoate synthase 2 [Methyloligella halotolerans]